MNVTSIGIDSQAADARRLLALLVLLGLALTGGLHVPQITLASEAGAPGADLHPTRGQQYYQDVSLNTEYFKGYLHDTRSVLTAPLSWRASDWLKFSLIVGAAVTVADEEDEMQRWVQAKRDDNTHFAADLAEPLGNGRYALPALGALYLYGRFSGRDGARRAALLSFESVIVSCTITSAIKYLSHKHRPTGMAAEDVPWDGPALSSSHVSFPSGHATCAFAIGTVVASEYRDNRLVPPLAYAAAAACAFSRMHDNAHWLSDVIIGSAIGHFTARTIVGLHGGNSSAGFSLVPRVSDSGPALSLSYKF